MTFTLYISGQKGLAALQGMEQESVGLNLVVIGRDTHITADHSEEIVNYCEARGYTYTFDKDTISNSSYLIAAGWRFLLYPTANQTLIVLHDSLLPKYRGFNPLVTALINGDEQIGVTALLGTDSYDQGPIVLQQAIGVQYPLKIADAIKKIAACYKEIVEALCYKIKQGALTPQNQDETKASYSLWRDDEDYFIDWTQTAEQIERHVNAVGYPYNGAKCRLGQQQLRVDSVRALPDVTIANRTPGKLIFKQEDKPVVVCGEGLLLLEVLKTEQGDDFSLGNKFRCRFK